MSAPAATIRFTSSPRRLKSAASNEGAILGVRICNLLTLALSIKHFRELFVVFVDDHACFAKDADPLSVPNQLLYRGA